MLDDSEDLKLRLIKLRFNLYYAIIQALTW